MTFADIPDDDFDSSDDDNSYRKVHYTKIIPGVNVRLRILDREAVHKQKYFIPSQRISIVAPENEEDDPIWQRNGKLIEENPDKNPREIKGFISRQNRYMVNVLNKTMVKRTDSGNVVFPTPEGFPTNDPETGELIANKEPEPLNRIEVLERGPTLFSQLNQINQEICDDAGNPIGIWNYDVVITATGKGTNMVTNVIPYSHHDDPVEIPEDSEGKYDLEDVGIELYPNEIQRVLNGVSLRDIFAARRGEDVGETDIDEENGVDVEDNNDYDDTDQNIADLFSE